MGLPSTLAGLMSSVAVVVSQKLRVGEQAMFEFIIVYVRWLINFCLILTSSARSIACTIPPDQCCCLLLNLLSLKIEIAVVFSRSVGNSPKSCLWVSMNGECVEDWCLWSMGAIFTNSFSEVVEAPRKSLLDVDRAIGSDKLAHNWKHAAIRWQKPLTIRTCKTMKSMDIG